MRRIAASKYSKSQAESDRGLPSLSPGRRGRSRPSQRIGRPPHQSHRPTFGPLPRPARSRPLIGGRGAKQIERALEVVDDFPEEIPIPPGELGVIETYLAGRLNEALELIGLAPDDPTSKKSKPHVE
jgi:hypothetical protein